MRSLPSVIMMDMELRRLRYFVAVAEHENFHRAAAAVHVAQSALSKHVRELSEMVGGPLFERTPRGVRMTFLGHLLYGEAKYLLDRLDGVYARAGKAVAGEIGRIAIGVNELGARHRVLARAVRLCRERHPGIELDFVWMNSPEQIEGLRSGKLDAGLLIERPQEALEFRHLRVAADPFVIALPADHPLASKDELEAQDLADQPFVGVKFSLYRLAQTRLITRCEAISLRPRMVQEVVTEQMQMTFIREGMGFGFVNRSVSQALLEGIRLLPLKGLDAALNIDLVWTRDNRSAALPLFVSILDEVRLEDFGGESV